MTFRFALAACLVVGGLNAFPCHRAIAQTPSGQSQPFAVIEGLALDSLHQGYLRGATIMVEGASVLGISDSLGRFRIDNVPPGVRRVDIVHPLLDTLGIALQTAPLSLVAGQTQHLTISTPSIQTVLDRRCTAGELTIGPAAVLGLVQFAESEQPATGSKVVFEWVEYKTTSRSFQTIPRRKIATVSPSGRFQFCGLPLDVAGTITGENGSDVTASIDVQIASKLSLLGLELPDPDASTATAAAQPRDSAGFSRPAMSRGGKAVLTGLVLDASGAPLSRARASVDGDSDVQLSGTDGRFVLHNLRSGTRTLTVRRLGFAPARVVVDLHSRTPAEVTVKLGEFVPELDTVRITASTREVGLARTGFRERQKTGTGFYMTPEDISRRNASKLADLLSTAPMLRRASGPNGEPIVQGRPRGTQMGCVTYFVDGVPWMGGGVEDFIYPTEVGALEVYSSGFTPAKFMHGYEQCETVVIWTKAKVGIR